jgi:hypothetical protein
MTVARWQAWDGPTAGLEHVEIRTGGERIRVEGVIVGANDGEPFGLAYRLVLDPAWRLREAALRTAAGRRLRLASDGSGLWTVDGRPDGSLSGCIDLDIEATPFTNTLPIRRLALASGEAAMIDVAYIQVPSLAVAPARQRYTAITPNALYRFESLDSRFCADLPVDPEGLVTDYPELFRRIA